MTWIKPAVRWGRKENGEITSSTMSVRRVADAIWGRSNVIKVLVVPYTVARKAGLLRRPK